jgi:hypothetical protein
MECLARVRRGSAPMIVAIRAPMMAGQMWSLMFPRELPPGVGPGAEPKLQMREVDGRITPHSRILRRFQMTMWNVEDVDGEPEVVLVRWRVMETEGGDRHLIGAREDGITGRVSTAITMFDSSRMMAMTQSGRTYQLHGAPGYNADAQYVWEQWCVVNGVQISNDVTAEFYDDPKRVGYE